MNQSKFGTRNTGPKKVDATYLLYLMYKDYLRPQTAQKLDSLDNLSLRAYAKPAAAKHHISDFAASHTTLPIF
ncbi:hypothetical protein FHL15_000320 [Xylaria flabelliformis]|uniref:Uncharacterized protein n=1 Tax=Xylaria flabelliformis TaxID=2512241 RepID=A0A553IFK2_9PEZI|nr:hypothetical protein FHL15_000320 [Xylaria flabelliformis]